MRFIVDLYRYIIVTFCGGTVVAVAVLVFAALDTSGPLAGQYPAWVLVAAAAVALLFVLSIGGLAMLVSLHDRHAALADAAHEAVAALQQIAQSVRRSDTQELDA